MRIRKNYLNQEYLLECFEYSLGVLYWKNRPLYHFENLRSCNSLNSRLCGKIAGRIDKRSKRWAIFVSGRYYYRSNIIWIMFNGDIPDGYEVDHKNRNCSDDSIDNLRLLTPYKNLQNKGDYSNNSLGMKGVWFDKKENKYRAAITHNNKRISLGRFGTVEEAEKAFKDAFNKRNNGQIIKQRVKYRGTSWNNRMQGWVARIGYKKKRIFLGCFQNRDDADRAYEEAYQKYYGDQKDFS